MLSTYKFYRGILPDGRIQEVLIEDETFSQDDLEPVDYFPAGCTEIEFIEDIEINSANELPGILLSE